MLSYANSSDSPTWWETRLRCRIINSIRVFYAYRFICIHIPKTTGHSLRPAFVAKGIELQSWGRAFWALATEQRTPDLVRLIRGVYCNEALASSPLQHLPAKMLREIAPHDVWYQYFKFSFVRNPWERLVSLYHHME